MNSSDSDGAGATLPKRATIDDVAARAGVSMMTVSRVMNNSPLVKDETRDRVQAAMAELSYEPSKAARTLATRDPMKIAFLYSIPNPAYLIEFTESGLEEAERNNAQLVFRRTRVGAPALADAREMVRKKGVRGFLLPPPLCDDVALRVQLAEAGVRFVGIGMGASDPAISTVGIDDERAAFEMTEHLLSLGHRRIAFICGHPDHRSSMRRLKGYQGALIAAGIMPDPTLEAQGLYTFGSGVRAAEALLGLDEMPTAVFASNDDMAAAMISVATSRGIDIPGELSVCGFDDTSMVSEMWPTLTTIRHPIAEMGRLAIQMLVAELRSARRGHKPRAKHTHLDFKLVRRGSDAPAHAGGERDAGARVEPLPRRRRRG